MRTRSKVQSWTWCLAFAVLIALTAGAWYWASSLVAAEISQRFDQRTGLVARAFASRLDHCTQLLQTLGDSAAFRTRSTPVAEAVLPLCHADWQPADRSQPAGDIRPLHFHDAGGNAHASLQIAAAATAPATGRVTFDLNDLVADLPGWDDQLWRLRLMVDTGHAGALNVFDNTAAVTHGRFQHSITVRADHLAWQLQFISTPAWDRLIEAWLPRVILLAGGLIGILMLLAWRLGLTGIRSLPDWFNGVFEQTDKHWKALVDAVTDYSILTLDATGRILQANTGAEKVHGYAPELLIGRSFSIFYPPEAIVAGLPQRELETASTTGRFEEEGWRINRAGERFFAHVVLTPIVDAAGQFHGYAKVTRDMTRFKQVEAELQHHRDQLLEQVRQRTQELEAANRALRGEMDERKHVEHALRLKEQDLRRLADAMPQIVWVADGATCDIVYVNSRWYEYTGLGPEESYGSGWVQALHPDDIEPCLAIWAKACAQAQPCQMEYRLRRADGVWHWHLRRSVPILEEGRVIKWYGTCTDIHELKEAEAQVRGLNQTLEQRVMQRTLELQTANRELESFSYSVSHDLRAPLRAIDGFSKALLEDCHENLDASGREYLERVRAASQRMGRLIDDMLALARITRQEINRVRIDLSALAQEVFDELSAPEANRAVQVTIEANLVVYADIRLLRIVLVNLIGNALKFTRQRARADIRIGHTRALGNEQVFFISDNGAGFDMHYVDKLFNAFQRLHGITEFEGNGVGLATVSRIIERHGGRIWAEAVPDSGATFYFTLGISGARA